MNYSDFNIFIQVLVFVHARNATVRTSLQLLEYARNRGDLEHFLYKEKDG